MAPEASLIETNTSCGIHTLASVVPSFEDSINVEAFLNSTQSQFSIWMLMQTVHLSISACFP
jgi:hypothetical protein